MSDLDFDWVEAEIHDFLRERLDAADAAGYVLGVSGGLDSAIGVRVAADAVGADRVTGMVLPGEPSDPENMADARALCESLGVEYRYAAITPTVEDLTDALPYEPDKLTVGNIRARIRMVMEYAEANEHDLLVLGADNRSEYLLGYFTKYGDGAVDIAPFGDLYKTELYEFAQHVGLAEKFIEKTPTAELWEGQTDPGELGAPYETIDAILRRAVDGDMSVEETAQETGIEQSEVERFVQMHEASEHKRKRPPTPGLR